MAIANRDRFVDFVATAVIFAWRWADATEDAREWNGAFENARRFAELRFSVRLQEARNINVARALVLTWRQTVRIVVAEDQLKVGATNLAQSIGLRCNHRLWFCLSRAADQRRVAALNINNAHAAGAEPRKFRVVAERWHLNAVRAADLKDCLSFKRFELLPVDLYIEGWRALWSLRAAC